MAKITGVYKDKKRENGIIPFPLVLMPLQENEFEKYVEDLNLKRSI